MLWKILASHKISIVGSILFPPSVFCDPPVTNYMLLYSTLVCKKIARAPVGHKKNMLTKLGGGGANGIDTNRSTNEVQVDTNCLIVWWNWRIFSVCAPPSLVGAYYLQPPDARAIFLHNDLLCNDTCSVTGGSITYWGGGTNGKDPNCQVISTYGGNEVDNLLFHKSKGLISIHVVNFTHDIPTESIMLIV